MTNWDPYLANGLKGKPLANRKEIRSLTDVERYLLVEGLAKFQNTPMDDPLSYFQIAGIHGLPFTKWPMKDWNKDFPDHVKDQGFLGFCTHTSILFLPWHRPYLALYEATLYAHVNEIANGIDASDGAQEFRDAAVNFRMPYWDWALPNATSVFPIEGVANDYNSVFKDKTRKWPLSTKSIFNKIPKYNPLHHAPFEKDFPDTYDGIKFENPETGELSDRTVRWPNYGEKEGENELVSQLNDLWLYPSKDKGPDPYPDRNLTERVYYLLLSYKYYGPMSHSKYAPKTNDDKTTNAETWASMEGIHNVCHNRVGGFGTAQDWGGHMSGIDRSAFDPVFWLHHTNIDRLWAIWQALHEDNEVPKEKTFVTPEPAGAGNWFSQGGRDANNQPREASTEGPNTSLLPFKSTPTTWYDSEGTRRTESFGYAYPETDGLKYPLDAKALEDMKAKVEKLYPGPPLLIQRSRNGVEDAGKELLPQVEILQRVANGDIPATNAGLVKLLPQLDDSQTLLTASINREQRLKNLAPKNEYLEWIVNIKGERHALRGKYTVDIFLDDVEEDNPFLWLLSPNHVGTFTPLGQERDTGCEKCKDQQAERMQVTGQIPLTLALMERYLAGKIPDITEDTVVPYLTKNLHWRVNDSGTVLANRAEVPGLTVYVVSNKVTLPEDPKKFPVYADEVKIYPSITTKPHERGQDPVGRGDGTGLTEGEVVVTATVLL